VDSAQVVREEVWALLERFVATPGRYLREKDLQAALWAAVDARIDADVPGIPVDVVSPRGGATGHAYDGLITARAHVEIEVVEWLPANKERLDLVVPRGALNAQFPRVEAMFVLFDKALSLPAARGLKGPAQWEAKAALDLHATSEGAGTAVEVWNLANGAPRGPRCLARSHPTAPASTIPDRLRCSWSAGVAGRTTRRSWISISGRWVPC
jgi:hypothetical protein